MVAASSGGGRFDREAWVVGGEADPRGVSSKPPVTPQSIGYFLPPSIISPTPTHDRRTPPQPPLCLTGLGRRQSIGRMERDCLMRRRHLDRSMNWSKDRRT